MNRCNSLLYLNSLNARAIGHDLKCTSLVVASTLDVQNCNSCDPAAATFQQPNISELVAKAK